MTDTRANGTILQNMERVQRCTKTVMCTSEISGKAFLTVLVNIFGQTRVTLRALLSMAKSKVKVNGSSLLSKLIRFFKKKRC